MSDFVPFDIQKEIIKRVGDLKSLIRFRSVSKPWKSFIDSPQFIAGYGARITHPPRFIVRYEIDVVRAKYVCFEDDDDDTFNQLNFSPRAAFSPLVEKLRGAKVIGTSHGLWCLGGYYTTMVVIWNPSIRKSVGIPLLRSGYFRFGFGVSPVNNDPTIVKILFYPWQVEVFTLSSGVWSLIPSTNLPPRESIRLYSRTPVVIDRFMYWVAFDKLLANGWPANFMIISFDLITKKFKEVTLPVGLENHVGSCSTISKLGDSLILLRENKEVNESVCVRIMVHDGVLTSFTKLFTIDNGNLSVNYILGFRKSGKVIMETAMPMRKSAALEVYEPCSQDTEDLEIYGDAGSFSMGCYKETLLLLDHSDGYIYSQN